VSYRDLPEADYAAALVQAGLPPAFAQLLAESDAKAADGALFDDSGTLGRLIGRPTTPLAEAVRQALATTGGQ
jgi:NAD(P)H dehydrogenase (quinone)